MLKEFECVLPTEVMEVDILIFLMDGRHGSLNVQVHVRRLPKKYTVGCLCQPYLRLLSFVVYIVSFFVNLMIY